jgi:hypothetical protein
VLALGLFLTVVAAAEGPVPTVDSQAAAVVALIYELKFDSAAAAAQGLAQSYPRHPAGAFYQGLVAYQRLSLEETPSRQGLADFEYRMVQTADLAQNWISTDAAQGHYYLGAALGFEARWLASLGRYFKAMPQGLRGVKMLKKAVALDPKLEDAYLALGLYHYFRSRLPPLAKPFAFLVSGEWGNRELGLQELRRAAERGALARTEALSAQANIYLSEDERKWDKAEAILKDLMDRYPRYSVFRLRRAYAAARRGAWEQAAELAEPASGWLADLDPALAAGLRRAALYRAAEARLLGGQAEKAAALLQELESQILPAELVDWVVLRRANLFDARGNDREADRLYRAVSSGATSKPARSFLKKRYPNGLKTVKPLTGIEAPS